MAQQHKDDDQAADFNSNIDPEKVYKIVQDAFGDLNTTFSTVRQSALDLIQARPFYALASAAVIGMAAGLVLRNQIVANTKNNDIAKH